MPKSNKRPAGDSTPIKKYENGEYMPRPFGPLQKAKGKNKDHGVNAILIRHLGGSARALFCCLGVLGYE